MEVSVLSKYTVMSTLQNNNYSLRKWHFEHMEQTVTGYLSGLSWDASLWETRLYKKYTRNLGYVCKSICFDVMSKKGGSYTIFFDKIRNDYSYYNIRNSSSIERLNR